MTTTRLAILIAALIGLSSPSAAAADFTHWFADSTLKLDLSLSGTVSPDAPQGRIALAGMTRFRGWHGRRAHLTDPLLRGAAEIVVTDRATGDTTYCHTFATLFQEWLVTDDPVGERSMEAAALIPWPRREADIHVSLRDNRHRIIGASTFTFDPSDILIADGEALLPPPATYLFRGERDDSAKIRVAILAEGYTPERMDTFRSRAGEAVDAILSHEPFTSLADRFDFIAIETPSRQSGVSLPAHGQWLDTAFGSHFSTFYSDRYLTSPRVWDIFSVLGAEGCSHAIVLADTPVYGGGGIYNFYTLTAADNEKFDVVTPHEFGHSFAGLADEYFYDIPDMLDTSYPLDIEPWEPNITARLTTPAKWQDLIDQGRAALVEGAGYRARGLWRGADDCRMRTNHAPDFCPVCRRAIERMIRFYTEP